ncbi:S41 family peptidase [Paucibacter sp. R3-3]|uniref:Tricorn protease homolog n=1 Tax=Roseateles agri TaxID=3098619 RepID=A0ABU5DA27_9BURK|nr:S41 family peptidase [Paucibacter sp. R3-3]MDY0743125.1 S41 family peptidase [Paucibacter sp. R3-3]
MLQRLSRLALAASLAVSGLHAQAQQNGFYRQPSLQGQQIVFVAEGDLWRVADKGGTAQRLTTHPGYETQPAVSPDGQWIAFVAQYDGTTARDGGDVYLMPAAGGLPKRLTWDGAGVRVWGFSAQGELIITAPTTSGQPGGTLYAIDPKTARRRPLPVAQATDGALSPDGKRLYFVRGGLAAHSDNAKQYRGGGIAKLWVLDLDSQDEAKPLLPEGNNDRRPMPYRSVYGEQRVAFLSDRDGTVNVWSVNAWGQDLREHTRLKGWDIRSASIDGTRIAYAVGADLHLLDIGAATDTALNIQLGGDFDQQRERFIAKPQDYLKQVTMAPDGERVLLASRGHLATQGVATLRRAELPQTADGRCRTGEFSADSKSVFALCDFSGEVEVWRFAANGLDAKPQQITKGATTLRLAVFPSPDGKQLAHTDKEGRLYLTDLQTLATREIVRDKIGEGPDNISWSPDGKALAFVMAMRDGNRQQLQLYTLADGKLQQLSSDRYDNGAPAFSPDGKWLYFLSRRDFTITGNASPWGDRNMGPYFDRGTKIYALALQPGLRFPFAPPDELAAAPDKKDDDKKSGDKKDEAKDGKDSKDKKPALPAIVTAGLAQRLYEVPVPPGNYTQLRATAKALWYVDTAVTTERKQSLVTVAIGNKGDKPDTVTGDLRRFALSADGSKLMIERGTGASEILLVDAAPKLPGELDKVRVRWTDWQIATDPKSEWREMFVDAWRMHRDYFFDKAMQGVDWNAVRAKYEPLVARVTDRAELSEILSMMSSEVGALHSQIATPDLRNGAADPAWAGLGAQLSRQPEGFRIERIYRSDPELLDGLSPLAAPGLDLKTGDVITAVNGRSAAGVADIALLLRGEAGHQVLLELKGGAKKIVLPVPLPKEQQLRYGDWRYSRGLAVEQASGGRIGYLHLRAMTQPDMEDFAREFYAQVDREGLIIDVRYNNGGSIESRILEKLMRRAWAFWQSRSPDGGTPTSNMQQVFRGHVVVIANEDTYSDGETFAEGFKRLGLGTLIGKKTAGAGVWLSDQNRLLDNGMARAAESAQILPDGTMIIEAKGVTPDVEVDNPPRATFEGHDAQLEAAIALLKKQMAEQPMLTPKPNAYPKIPQY